MAVLDLLLPSRCAACGAPGPSPCPGCGARLVAAPVLPPPPGLDSLSALLRYDGPARALVTAAKYRNARSSLAVLAPAAAALVPELAPGTVVTWAPTTPQRARRRGFDQAELVARLVGRRLRHPVRALLVRRPGPHQTGRPAAERRHDGPVVEPRGPVPATVLLVDDVCTTGATLAACAAALRDRGATTVHGLVLARTPAGQAPR